jgi:hypothetical protein
MVEQRSRGAFIPRWSKKLSTGNFCVFEPVEQGAEAIGPRVPLRLSPLKTKKSGSSIRGSTHFSRLVDGTLSREASRRHSDQGVGLAVM